MYQKRKNQNLNIKIIVACHKKCDVPDDSNIYLPVHVGAEGKELFGFTPDDTGENISAKNFMYSELTGLYWAWKNLDCDYLGLVHYRRCFAMHKKTRKASLKDVLTEPEVKELLSHHDIIIPMKRKYYIETIYSHYSHTFDGTQLDNAREIISEQCPDYMESFDSVMRRRWGYMFNMYIMPKSLSDKYCEWLFRILFMLETRIDRSGMNDFDMRYPGRVSERLFNVWLDHALRRKIIEQSDICEVPCVYTGRINWGRKIISFLMAKSFHKRYEKSF